MPAPKKTDENADIGARLRAIKERRLGKDQDGDLADAIGMGLSGYQQIERGYSVLKLVDVPKLAAGVRELGIHAGRHFVASFLLAFGVPLAEVAAMLGHASSATTLGVYDHELGAERQAPAALDTLLGP